MSEKQEKPLKWIASALDDLKDFPEDVQDVMGYALDLAQHGEKHPDAKPLHGFTGTGVLEIVDDFEGDTYRAIYTFFKKIRSFRFATLKKGKGKKGRGQKS
ncbi:MAG: type II toxin-antitoxin system RelE/ParE family toxin [Nostoc sp.]|uniref:type II toxin-antitoxin system RelE/ParE family toxin n=1 Tax=Nostoc sp. TaxID=1180 RepID=UPI002FFBAE15